MNELDYAKELGIDLSEIPDEDIIKYEKKYLVIIEIIRNDKKYSMSNIDPIKDIHEAKKIALSKAAIKIKDDDTLSFRVLEIHYADVLIESNIQEPFWDFQPIHSRWFYPWEIKEIFTK